MRGTTQFNLAALLAVLASAASCGENKAERPADTGMTAPAAGAETSAPAAKASEQADDLTLEQKCKVFEPPWKGGGWVEWGQANPEAGEEWYDTIEETMSRADLSVLPRCTELEYVFVGFSKLPDLSSLAGLKRIKRLDLRMMPQIKDLSLLRGLENLEYLNITGTGVEDLSPLADVESLVELEARMLTVKDLAPLGALPNLVSIDFLKCPVADIGPLRKAPKLEKALLCNTDVADIGPLEEAADRLTALDLCDSRFRDFEKLRSFRRLTFLRLWGLPIEDLSVLSGMTEMDDLDLSKTPVKDLSPLHGMKKLKVLRLLMVDIDPKQIEALRAAVPGVEIIQKITAS